MKRLKTILSMMMGLCAMLLLTACPSPDPEPDEKLSASPSSVTITPENTSAYFSVSSNTRISSLEIWEKYLIMLSPSILFFR